jgi:hydroxymethylpyrimidine/phosphomethylpyrimidine kinase
MNHKKNVLTIAGSDSSGGAGIQADIKTFEALNVYSASIIISVTAQNTQGIQKLFDLPDDIVSSQINAVFSDI